MNLANVIAEQSKLVAKIARQYQRPGIELDDLIQEGNLGLLKAVGEWVPGAGASFVSVAANRIKDACRNFVRSEHDSVSLDSEDDQGLTGHELVGEPAEQEEIASRHETIDAVRAAMTTLGERDREVLRAWTEAYSEGDCRKGAGAVPEMAARAGIPRTTMDARVRAARKRLEREVAPFVDQIAKVAS